MTILKLTDDAVEHLQKMLSNSPNAVGIKISVKDAGCSGKSYSIDFTDSFDEQNNIIENTRGVNIAIDRASIKYLQGTTIDYPKQGLNSFLKFINPNATNQCGCGESFQLKE